MREWVVVGADKRRRLCPRDLRTRRQQRQSHERDARAVFQNCHLPLLNRNFLFDPNNGGNCDPTPLFVSAKTDFGLVQMSYEISGTIWELDPIAIAQVPRVYSKLHILFITRPVTPWVEEVRISAS